MLNLSGMWMRIGQDVWILGVLLQDMGGAPVSWSAKCQIVVALLSIESEYISTSWGA